MGELNLLFAGFGGQGVLFCGKVAGYAGLIDGKEVSWLPSYGPEMRGGTANCSVCISEEPIGSPAVTEPDVLVAMNAPSYDKFIGAVKPGGKVIMDSSLFDRECTRSDIEVYKIPATKMASGEGISGPANMILLGKLLKESEFTSIHTIQEAMARCVPQGKAHLIEHNMRAIGLGMEL